MRYQFKREDVPPRDIPAANQDNVQAIVCRACELGITHFETARGCLARSPFKHRIPATLQEAHALPADASVKRLSQESK